MAQTSSTLLIDTHLNVYQNNKVLPLITDCSTTHENMSQVNLMHCMPTQVALQHTSQPSKIFLCTNTKLESEYLISRQDQYTKHI